MIIQKFSQGLGLIEVSNPELLAFRSFLFFFALLIPQDHECVKARIRMHLMKTNNFFAPHGHLSVHGGPFQP